MRDPYARLRAVEKASSRPKKAVRSVGVAMVGLLMDNRTGAVQFEDTAVDASTYRRAANRHILSVAPKLVVSIYRLDPGAPGGASRKSTWEAVLMTRVGAS